MNNLDSWIANNEEYLANALAWLRWRLCELAQLPDIEKPKVTEITITRNIHPSPAISFLSQKLDLSDFEQQVLLLCVAMELDPGMARLCARAFDNSHQAYPTFALALSIFEQPTWDALSWERPLRYWRLIEIHQSGVQPLTTSGLRVDERILNYIKGLNSLDDRLASLLMPLETEEWNVKLPPSQKAVVETIILQLCQSDKRQRLPIIQLVGADSLSKQLIAQQITAQLDKYVYRLSVELLPTQAGELETVARLWHRESLLLPLALYLDAQEIDKPTTEGQALPLHRFLTRSGGLLFLSTRELRQLGLPTIVIDVEKPTPSEQKATWTEALVALADSSPQLLATQFNLNLVNIEQIAQQVLAETPNCEIQNRLWSACLASTRPQLDTLAQRLDPKATWDNIVLPPEETSLLHQIADQIRQRSLVYQEWGFHNRMNRGMGISALFAGESGTGKTMAAEVIANDLQLNLYRIDLSSVVNKYIGETEKNLRRLFDAAEDGGAILFFDEADALFGKRSEVKDSHDRYANIEVNYLLQRLEAYRGLVILATNLKSSLDHAFMRRLRFIVNFPFPGVAERQVMWQKVFPPETPIQDLDFNRLARLNMTGGSIHNIALNAAFLAAGAGTPVTMQLVLAAARAEFRKLDRPVNEADFRVSVSTGVRE
ncbi:ATP-binding protein [Nostocaceae cyanobacterium CENA369]|uniref:ATP-binding protein n=1 Tax=Dendronalium phyllosphericum CENA369 TaxID=1725256 RepID=A0A8J7LL43_9NOST|nr:ATP-binding protein [Dendronalium phyllosphericum]MBH8578149.1 ATP-binding protein [Dendronalium phyllosphericum CENA369]